MVMSQFVYPALNGQLGGFPILAIIRGGGFLAIRVRVTCGARPGQKGRQVPQASLRAVVLIHTPQWLHLTRSPFPFGPLTLLGVCGGFASRFPPGLGRPVPRHLGLFIGDPPVESIAVFTVSCLFLTDLRKFFILDTSPSLVTICCAGLFPPGGSPFLSPKGVL